MNSYISYLSHWYRYNANLLTWSHAVLTIKWTSNVYVFTEYSSWKFEICLLWFTLMVTYIFGSKFLSFHFHLYDIFLQYSGLFLCKLPPNGVVWLTLKPRYPPLCELAIIPGQCVCLSTPLVRSREMNDYLMLISSMLKIANAIEKPRFKGIFCLN